MKKITPPTTGKIMMHAKGTGLFSEDDVSRRAYELALIDGRAKAEPRDREQAMVELRGGGIPETGEEQDEGRRGMTRDPSDPPSDPGEEKPSYEAADEQKAAERMVLEGVEEAQHELMVEDRKRRQRETDAS